MTRLPRLLQGLCALLLCAVAATPMPAQARGRHVLWAVQGQHNTVYLLGSVHVLRASDGGLPDEAMAAYRDAEQLVMELDMDELLADPTAMRETSFVTTRFRKSSAPDPATWNSPMWVMSKRPAF